MAISSHFYFWLAQYTPTLLAESFSGNERAQTKMAMSWMRGEKKKKIFLAELASWQHKKVRNGKIIVIFSFFLKPHRPLPPPPSSSPSLWHFI